MLTSYIVPHPPIARSSVGRGEEKKIQATLDGYRAVSARIAEEKPETIIVISPHNVMFRDAFYISPGDVYRDSLERFGYPEEQVHHNYDQVLIDEILDMCADECLPVCTDSQYAHEADYGTLIPLLFVDEAYTDYSVVRIAPSFLDNEMLLKMGSVLERSIAHTGKRVSIIASGDLSHKLKKNGPYGFAWQGPVFDRCLCNALRENNLSALTMFDPQLTDAAAECGLPGFIILIGALKNHKTEAHFLSYEGTFGVGYAVCTFEAEDWCTYLAKQTLEEYVRTGRQIQPPANLPAWMYHNKASVFVSLHKNGELRGCIGSIEPWRDCVAEEIIALAIEAGTDDPRFRPVRESELADIEYSVDVLFPAEPAEMDMLDPVQYGVIVTSGSRRGLLLPNLEGVDTVNQQVSIALSKAGISPEDDYTLERFRVERHCR